MQSSLDLLTDLHERLNTLKGFTPVGEVVFTPPLPPTHLIQGQTAANINNLIMIVLLSDCTTVTLNLVFNRRGVDKWRVQKAINCDFST